MSIHVPGGAGAPGRARRLVGPQLGHVLPSTASDAVLIVSELVTNSVRHAHVGVDKVVVVDVSTSEKHLRIAVTDPGSELEPRLLPGEFNGLGGHGLRLVEQLSEAWGVSHDTSGATQVWCDLALAPS
jgi:anti-sigma regulatory factor (Ser/Thr protein kinase)